MSAQYTSEIRAATRVEIIEHVEEAFADAPSAERTSSTPWSPPVPARRWSRSYAGFPSGITTAIPRELWQHLREVPVES